MLVCLVGDHSTPDPSPLLVRQSHSTNAMVPLRLGRFQTRVHRFAAPVDGEVEGPFLEIVAAAVAYACHLILAAVPFCVAISGVLVRALHLHHQHRPHHRLNHDHQVEVV